MKRIRGGRGLGDSIYLRPVVEHLIARGDEVTALTDYPDVFAGTGAATEPFTRERCNLLAHYSSRKSRVGSTQWEDVCDCAGVGRLPFRTDWKVRNHTLVERVRTLADGRPLLLVHGGRAPMGRDDGFGKELLPRKEAFGEVLDALGDCFLVQIGQAEQIYPLRCDLSLNGHTTITDLMDLGVACDGAVGQCSYVVPLAEIFDKPLLAVWAARGMQAPAHPYIRQITPTKVLSGAKSTHVVDDWSSERIREAVRAFRAVL